MCVYLLPFPRYSWILVENRYPFVFGAPVRVEAVRLTQQPLMTKKTRMSGLSDSERISMICLAVLIQITRVTDRWTDGQTELAWHIRTIAYMLSRVKSVQHYFCQTFVKFPPILKIFGTTMVKRISLCEVHSFSTSPNLCQHTTVLNADVLNCS